MRLLSKSTRRNNLDHTNVFFVQSEEYKKQMLEKYGAEYAMQESVCQSYTRKVLGYEDKALDDLHCLCWRM